MILDDHIGALDIEAIAGQSRTIRLEFDDAPGGAWTIHFGLGRTVVAPLVAASANLTVALTGDQVTSALAWGSYRIRQNGADRIGGTFRPAAPQATPGPDTVTVVLGEASTVTVSTTSSTIDGGTL
ncbi:hypothetical protein KSP35_13005 [Aquihabitans sp. G128]|uniref:hypothetical protein n=1 Tax=Aquihabitans sp. G128 TaxID=2849779 RepID=UPI001C22BDDA|nr:hypothetical protein [Aquihabitans sp. G128]QXC59321.1 hypothetical protein KSP35_13005 [Aquihabitans sp. G128]